MRTAIAYLQTTLSTLETNEPINRLGGDVEQADLESVDAAQIRQAIAVLGAATNGPIWPEPTLTHDKTDRLQWNAAPTRTEYGAGMMEALVALGKDHTLRLYAEAEAAHLVDQVLSAYYRPDVVVGDLVAAIERLLHAHYNDGINYSGDHPAAEARRAVERAQQAGNVRTKA